MYPGERGGQLGSFYTVIVAVIIGVDRLLYLFVILIPLKSSAELSYIKCWTGLKYQRPGGSNVNILYGGEERRGEKPVKRLNNNTLVSPKSASCSLSTLARGYSNLLKCYIMVLCSNC